MSVASNAPKTTKRGPPTGPAYSLYAFLAAILAIYYAYPSESNPLNSFITISYPEPAASGTGTVYGKGPRDLHFVAFYGVVLFAARDFTCHVLGDGLVHLLGIKGSGRTKFPQQLWEGAYFAFIALFGLYVMRRTPMWYFDMPGLFEGFPHRTLIAPFKVFYLLHSGNWVQAAAMTFLQLEKARKDNGVLILHHVVTLIAIPLVYMAHLTHFALVMIIPHDITDSLLSFAKCISYTTKSPIISMPYFTFFVGSWIYFRHYIGGITFWTLLTQYRPAITTAYGWGGEEEQWKAATLHGIVVALFGALQLMNAYWLFLILRIAARAITGEIPKDDRESDEEGEAQNQRQRGKTQNGKRK
ncbi:TLC domain-containing protein [Aspergillus pseudoustus]|uniref:TLC domain-containing protein n=1 Tax=Aspergillus pseudoustus TaxID=1810923 RepID=A0ABR4KD59_9EURO